MTMCTYETSGNDYMYIRVKIAGILVNMLTLFWKIQRILFAEYEALQPNLTPFSENLKKELQKQYTEIKTWIKLILDKIWSFKENTDMKQ